MTGVAPALAAVLALAGAVLLLGAGWAAGRWHARHGERAAGTDLGTPVERATFHTLHFDSGCRCRGSEPRKRQ